MIAFFHSGPNTETPIIDILNLAECRVMSIFVRPDNTVIPYFDCP